MAGLNRTNLTTLDKAQLVASAVAAQGRFGGMSEVARLFGVSRPTAYEAAREGLEVLLKYFDRQEQGAVEVQVDQEQLLRALVALRVVGKNSIRVIEDLLPILYPRINISYGKIQGILSEAESRAAVFNRSLDMSGVKAGALDEMFSQGSPVLAGVDLDSGFLFSLEMRESRGAEDWAQVLEVARSQGVDLEVVTKDAAPGIAAGVRQVFPNAEQRDDCFHAHYEMGKLLRRLEAKAFGMIAAEHEAERSLERMRKKSDATSAELVAARRELASAKKRCVEFLALHDQFSAAMEMAQEGLEIVDLETGCLRSAEEIEEMLRTAGTTMLALDDKRCRKVGRYITNRAPGLALYAEAFNRVLAELAESRGEEAVRLACIILRLRADMKLGRHRWRRYQDRRHVTGALALLTHRLGAHDAASVLADVEQAMQRRHRASSAIEGFNAALRPHLYVQKGVTQGFLGLFQAYYNLRSRRWGRHKGTSAYETMTGTRVDDWLTLLGYPPSHACLSAKAA